MNEIEYRAYLAKMHELVVAIDRLTNAMSMWAGMFGPVANAILAFTEEYLELKEKVKP